MRTHRVFIVAHGNSGTRYLPMIVCSCNVFSDHDVRSACSGDERPATCGQVYGCLGCSAQCGRCARTIRKIMDEALQACPVPADVACAHVHVETE